MKIFTKEFDVTTGEEVIFERDATKEEIEKAQLAEAKAIELAKKVVEEATARKLLLQKLGITEEEAKLLLG